MANWYVSQKVASSGAGSSLAAAFKTIAEAIAAAASSDDTVYVYEGVYNETITCDKSITIIGAGRVEMNGGSTHLYGITTASSGLTWTIKNIIFKNYVSYAIYTPSAAAYGVNLIVDYCTFFSSIYMTKNSTTFFQQSFKNSLFYNIILKRDAVSGNLIQIDLYNNTFISCQVLLYTAPGSTKQLRLNKNIFKNTQIKLPASEVGVVNDFMLINNFEGCSISFNNSAVTAFANLAALIVLYEAQTSFSAGSYINSNVFLTAIFNNSVKSNYSLDYDVVNNPIAFAGFSGQAIGALQAAANIICKATASAGDCDIYNITTDVYSLGIFGGVANVGAIDNTNEKLYRTSDGANNWGVFVASTDLPRSHIIRNLRLFGTLIDRNGGQVSETPGDFAYNYQIDILVKWSATLTKSALLADTSIPFVRFRFRPNEFNYYVDNSGTLVGDGDPGYLALVSSADGGSGSLPPQKIVGKSFVAIIILQDA
jgi:hypothetical protein